MSVALSLHASAVLLLVVAGIAKLWRPQGLLGFAPSTRIVRLAGAAEVVTGSAALIVGAAVTWLVGLIFAALALVVWRAMHTGAASCGCFGAFDAAPSPIHVGVNVMLAVASVWSAADGSGQAPVAAVVTAFADYPTIATAVVVEIVVLTGLILVSLTALPEALAARRPSSVTPGLFRAVAAPAVPLPPDRPGRSGEGSGRFDAVAASAPAADRDRESRR